MCGVVTRVQTCALLISAIAVAIAPATDGTVAFSAGPGRAAAQCGAAHAVASLRNTRRYAVRPQGLSRSPMLKKLSEWPVNRMPSGVSRSASRSEEHTSELQSLMRNSYAVFCLQNKK